MRSLRLSRTKLCFLILFIFILGALYLEHDTSKSEDSKNSAEMLEFVDRLERSLETDRKKINELTKEIFDLRKPIMEEHVSPESKQWNEPIPVLVFTCNRALAVRDLVQKLIRYRPSKEKFPIIISQDCDNEDVRNEVMAFGDEVQYIKHIAGDQANLTIPPNHRRFTTYYLIARHYKLGLDHLFKQEKYTSVIITEDDLDIAPDFFSYFSSTRYLLEHDPKLWCVTAWNDNGKPQTIDLNSPSKLYRTDFFAGLGWMMTSKTWNELGADWPSGFWDDWMRTPLRRKDRQCIRPEVSRTGMTKHGRKGASVGQFFNKHVSKIKVNDDYVDFSKIDLDYLLPKNFEKLMQFEVLKNSELLNIEDVAQFLLNPDNTGRSVRVMYDGNEDYIRKADALRLMHDFKDGVPRTAYDGIVSCFIGGVRIFLVPDRSKVPSYDSTWFVRGE